MKKKCVICNKIYEGYGNNARPVKNGSCCDSCNRTVVITARIDNLKRLGVKL